MAPVELWTDGGQHGGNPGPGGWAAILRTAGPGGVLAERVLTGGDPDPLCTNNRMELTAVIEGLRVLVRPCEVLLMCDSMYVLNGIEQGWVDSWRRRGWRARGGGAVKNRELWELLDEQVKRHVVHCVHVKGHSGVALNERCDTLAKVAAEMAVAKAVIAA